MTFNDKFTQLQRQANRMTLIGRMKGQRQLLTMEKHGNARKRSEGRLRNRDRHL